MAPKKKGDGKKGKKDKVPEIDPKAVIKEFTDVYHAAAKAHAIEPLQLPLPEECIFQRLVIHGALPGGPQNSLQTKVLTEALVPYGYLQNLCFWKANVGDDGVMALAQYLKNNNSVTNLELSDCNITGAGCLHIAEAFKDNETLLKLNLDHNDLGDAGMTNLGNGLKWNRALAKLSLRYCHVTPDGAMAIALSFFKLSRLRDLDLQGNQLEASGVAAILEAIKKNNALQRIGLADTCFSTEEVALNAIKECILVNKTCIEFDFNFCLIGDSAALTMIELLKTRTHVIEFNTTERIDAKIFKALCNVVEDNRKEWLKANKPEKKSRKKGGKKKK